MRLLWSLPKAAPALLRHLFAYAELAVQDLERTKHDVGVRILVAIVLVVAVFFALSCACLLVVALTWNTIYRVAAIEWMGAGFSLIAIGCALYRSKVIDGQPHFLGTVRREWAEDRVILEKILSEK